MPRFARPMLCLLAAALLAYGAHAAADDGLSRHGRFAGDWEQRGYEPPRGSWNSWYGPSRPYRDEHVGDWAIGTFHGRNGANGQEETITIQPDGSVEIRSPGEPPRYGKFAGTTITLGTLAHKIEPTRGGVVIDGAYYRR